MGVTDGAGSERTPREKLAPPENYPVVPLSSFEIWTLGCVTGSILIAE
jgi:hypothetical protein